MTKQEKRSRITIGSLIAALCACISTHFAGCVALEPYVTRSASEVGEAVNAYCENFTPDQRAQFGDLVRAASEPDSIEVTCAD